MTFTITVFCISLLCFFMFADKKAFYLIATTCYVAMILALVTDLLMFIYPLWEYPSPTNLDLFIKQMMHVFGIYPVVTYFFLQTLPNNPKIIYVFRHIFSWSIFAISIEWIYLKAGQMKHGLWWNIWFSYLSDLILYLIFYIHHSWRKNHL